MIDWFTPFEWDEDAHFVSSIHIGEEKKSEFLKTIKKYRMTDEKISKINLALSLLPYESFKHLLSNDDCLKIVRHGGGDSLFDERPVEAPKFLSDLVERSKANPEIKNVFYEAAPSARITLLLMGSFLGRDAGENDVIQLLSSFKKLRGFRGSLEEMIYQDVETLFLSKEAKERDQLTFLSQMCFVSWPFFQNTALQVLEQNKNNFITWQMFPEGVGGCSLGHQRKSAHRKSRSSSQNRK